ncbi:MAG: class I SAM-dependent methyltransferase [Chitinispirillaceae bacterium]|nr:class I SAM-dependent methyltransferase [Chitinispirillaceae bacterium]
MRTIEERQTMGECRQDAGIAFFDSIAPEWDSREDLESLKVNLDKGLACFGLEPAGHILEVGCGTGNLTAALLRALSPSGKITAVDISGKMVEIARAKINDPRVCWIHDAVEHLAPSPERFDRIFCCSVWPHLTNPGLAADLFFHLLKPGGRLHIWHLISREAVNTIHANASAAVSDHLLAPASETAALLEQAGFAIEKARDDNEGYLVTGRKESRE